MGQQYEKVNVGRRRRTQDATAVGKKNHFIYAEITSKEGFTFESAKYLNHKAYDENTLQKYARCRLLSCAINSSEKFIFYVP